MRKRQRNRLPITGLCALVLAIAAGCATTTAFRAAPQLQDRVGSIKTVAIMPISVKVYQDAVWSDRQLMQEVNSAATQRIARAIEKELERHAGIVFKPFPAPSASLDASQDPAAARLTAELKDTQALFEAVSDSIKLHTYGPVATGTFVGRAYDQTFLEKLKNFDYSLGPDVQQFAKLAKADALLFIAGVELHPSGGEQALMTVFCPAFAWPLIFPAFECFAELGGTAILSVALVDGTTGVLLWYNGNIWRSLTSPDSLTDLAEWVFKEFPLGTRPTQTRLEYEGGAWSRTPDPR